MIWSQNELDEKIKELENGSEALSTNQVSDLLGITRATAIDYLIPANVISVTKEKGAYHWNRESVLMYVTSQKNYQYLLKDSPEYISSKEIEEQYGDIFTIHQIRYFAQKNRDTRISMTGMPTKIKYRRDKLEETIAQLPTERTFTTVNGTTLNLKDVQYNKDYTSYLKVVKELECPKWYLKHMIRYRQLPNSADFSTADSSYSHTYVHKDDYPILKDLYDNKVVFGDRNSFSEFDEEKEPIDRFNNMLKNHSFEEDYPITHGLYYEFVSDYIANTRTVYVYNYVTSLSKTYMQIGPLLNKEVHLYTNKELEMLFLHDSLLKKYKEVLGKFSKFIQTKMETNYSSVPTVRNRVRQNNKNETYSREVFYNMYRQVIDLNRHLEKAIISQTYCQDWFLLIMTFSNAWRIPDIVKIPSPNLTLLNIPDMSINWFKHNKLSPEQAIRLIKDLQNNNRFIINKTNALNELFVPTDMTVTFATGISLLELYRQERDKDTETLFPNYIKPSKDASYFNYIFEGDLPSFSFKKTTKSLLTYSYITARNMDEHAGAANAISTRLRGHKDIDSIQHYVLPSGDDFDDIFRHLYRRGHFGYLYSLMVDLSIKQGERELNIEEKTESIETLMKIFSPEDLEESSAFYFEQRKQLQSISQQVIQLSKEELDQKLTNIHNGNMPSYRLEGQCFISGECNQPGRNCSSCKYLVPKVSFLLSAKNEIYDLIGELSITEETNHIKRTKLTHLILSLLAVVNQSVKTFGKEYANEYFDFGELKTKLSAVQTKMLE